ncbi:hypothetical protein [Rhizobium sp. C4]|uniref:hypothetical protein n=1 Tax=Rhizobium sp. C4 TaxID=1349800 RepID=UPI001E657E17|nr:hypothetical protein [Rhizobium sp. C4]MCD2175851.1 hypothetical protein [Rhizobium sp. C4]
MTALLGRIWGRAMRAARWHIPFVSREDILGSATAAALLVIAAVAAIYGFKTYSNFGFDRNWDCMDPGHGEPVCVKKIPGS